jgi:hypothetical protein
MREERGASLPTPPPAPPLQGEGCLSFRCRQVLPAASRVLIRSASGSALEASLVPAPQRARDSTLALVRTGGTDRRATEAAGPVPGGCKGAKSGWADWGRRRAWGRLVVRWQQSFQPRSDLRHWVDHRLLQGLVCVGLGLYLGRPIRDPAVNG